MFRLKKRCNLLDGDIELKGSNLYATIPVLGKEWTVSLEINPSGITPGWTNVIHCGLGCTNSDSTFDSDFCNICSDKNMFFGGI